MPSSNASNEFTDIRFDAGIKNVYMNSSTTVVITEAVVQRQGLLIEPVETGTRVRLGDSRCVLYPIRFDISNTDFSSNRRGSSRREILNSVSAEIFIDECLSPARSGMQLRRKTAAR